MFVHLHVNHTYADFHISVDLYHISLDLYHDTSPSLIGDAADYFLSGCSTYLASDVSAGGTMLTGS